MRAGSHSWLEGTRMTSRAIAATAPLQLPNAPGAYDVKDQQQLRTSLIALERRLAKLDAEARMQRLCLQDTVTGTWYNVTIASGAVSLVAIT